MTVAADGFAVVGRDISGAVIQYIGIHILLRMDINLLLPGGILKAQLIKPAALVGFERMVICVLVVGKSPGERLSS